jgi:Phage integrase family
VRTRHSAAAAHRARLPFPSAVSCTRSRAQSVASPTSERGRLNDPVFPGARDGRLSADALQRLVSRHVGIARRACSSPPAKHVKPHTLRHAAAMALLRLGVDLSVIALWLGTCLAICSSRSVPWLAPQRGVPLPASAVGPLAGFLEGILIMPTPRRTRTRDPPRAMASDSRQRGIIRHAAFCFRARASDGGAVENNHVRHAERTGRARRRTPATIVRTCQLQEVNGLVYLTAAIAAHRRRQPPASLLRRTQTPELLRCSRCSRECRVAQSTGCAP